MLKSMFFLMNASVHAFFSDADLSRLLSQETRKCPCVADGLWPLLAFEVSMRCILGMCRHVCHLKKKKNIVMGLTFLNSRTTYCRNTSLHRRIVASASRCPALFLTFQGWMLRTVYIIDSVNKSAVGGGSRRCFAQL
jgi:hypothetical protein